MLCLFEKEFNCRVSVEIEIKPWYAYKKNGIFKWGLILSCKPERTKNESKKHVIWLLQNRSQLTQSTGAADDIWSGSAES